MASLKLVEPDSFSEGWRKVLKESESELRLVGQVLSRMGPFLPEQEKLFEALKHCPLDQTRVIILGQDPYHTPGQANGLAFSTSRGHPIQPSLRNIYAELAQEYSDSTLKKDPLLMEEYQNTLHTRDYIKQYYRPGEENDTNKLLEAQAKSSKEQLESFIKMTDQQIWQFLTQDKIFVSPDHGDLTSWAQQGVLLLNTCLTVAPHQPGSHKEIWNGVVMRILNAVQEINPEVIVLLWGAKAQGFRSKLGQRTIILTASHPSPFSAHKGSRDAPAFMGCGHFKMVNEILAKQGKLPIRWQLK